MARVDPKLVTPVRALLRFAAMALLPVATGCTAFAGPPSACDGLVYEQSGLTRKQYLPCAGEMIAKLDVLDGQVDSMLDGEEASRAEALASVRDLRKLLDKAGGQDLLERWDDRSLTNLNVDIWNAFTSHEACMMVAGQLFGKAPLGDEKYRDAARSQCTAYRQAYRDASGAYRYLR